MLTRPACFLFLLLIGMNAAGQEFTSFGNANAYELQLKEVPFDPQADAVVLMHEAISNYDDDHQLITKHHVKIKVLKENGLQYANVSVPYYLENDFEIIKDIQAIVVNAAPSGEIERTYLDGKNIYKEKSSPYIGRMKFSFPNVKVGSILDYKFTSVMKHYGGLENWYFQREIPTIKSNYQLYILPNTEFSYVAFVANGYKVDVSKNPGGGSVAFAMNNIPALRDEPYMDSRKDYLQRVDFQLASYGGNAFNKRSYMGSWSEVIKELLGNQAFGSQLNKRIPDMEDFIKLAKTAAPSERISLVFDRVKTQMTWNGYDGKFSDGVKDAWNKKTGTSADINLALVNLLREVDIDAHPLLVSERYNGSVNEKLPFLDQFNKVIAIVELDGKALLLDATNKLATTRLVPSSVLNTKALLVKRKEGGIISISDNQTPNLHSVVSSVEVKDNRLLGEVYVNFNDYNKIEHLASYRANNKGYIDLHYQSALVNGTIENFESLNEVSDTLSYRHQFKFNQPVNESGGYYFLPSNLFTGFGKNPFLEQRRFSNINFGAKQNLSYTMRILIKDSLKVDALPKPVLLTMPDRSIIFSREILKSEHSNELVCRIKFETSRSMFDASEYTSLQDFYKKMYAMLDEQIILKK